LRIENFLSAALLCLFCVKINAQNDTVPTSVELEEIVVSAKAGFDRNCGIKSSATLDEYLQQSEKVQMIKRGGYAWEPTVNNMTTERISVTIDGMKIFCACTDRMDPVTSYVETSNLSQINVGSGFGGNPQATGNIGGSINLMLNKAGFGLNEWNLNANTGFESNGNVQIYGFDGYYSADRFYANAGFSYRHSDSYRAGGGEEIRYSQYTKNNVFTNFGFQPRKGHVIEGTIIADLAVNVGYPALLMDVSMAKGIIGSLAYRRHFRDRFFYKWETKAYFNRINHTMDDSKREGVINGTQMSMDMPGLSATGGLYSTLVGSNGKHNYTVNFDAYSNRSYAEMTMYPLNSARPPMFMLTWGDVRTFNSGIALSDEITVNDESAIRLSAKTSWQRSGQRNEEGFRELQNYYPDYSPYAERFLWKEPNRLLWDLSGRYFAANRAVWNVSARYLYRKDGWEFSGGGGYGARAPSVSESFGYFLYNTFDGYDYLGNPTLKNEKSLEINAAITWHNETLNVKLDGSAFRFSDYIIGKPDENLSGMTVGASGVKVYRNLPRASIINTGLTVKYYFAEYFQIRNHLAFAVGRDDSGKPLPLIAPLTGDLSVSYRKNHFAAETALQYAAKQTSFSPDYGETGAPSYAIANLSAGYSFKLNKLIINLKAGVENLFDRYYSTYADWKRIPQRGRNLFVNVGVEL